MRRMRAFWTVRLSASTVPFGRRCSSGTRRPAPARVPMTKTVPRAITSSITSCSSGVGLPGASAAMTMPSAPRSAMARSTAPSEPP